MSRRFEDRHILLTGGGNGIGRATATAFASEGAHVTILDIAPEHENDTVSQIQRFGGSAHFIRCDVSDEANVQSAVAEAIATHGAINVLHNHAGTVIIKPFLDMQAPEWDRLMAVNVRSMFLVTRAVLPFMIEQGGGAIVNTSSVTGVAATPLEIAYCVTKGAIHMFTRGIATEFRDQAIRCNAVCPAFVRTAHGLKEVDELAKLGFDIGDADIAAMQGRICEPEEVSPSVLFLASDEASFINGETLYVDNGLLAKAG